MQLLIPTSLCSYSGRSGVEASGATLGELLADLGRQFPGLRFRMVDDQDRMRPHMRVFVSGKAIHDLAQPLRTGDDVNIVQALSGG